MAISASVGKPCRPSRALHETGHVIYMGSFSKIAWLLGYARVMSLPTGISSHSILP